jgi:antitoxin (DNA-binding transcriptional repressor) of toxin-antitoxin stability system
MRSVQRFSFDARSPRRKQYPVAIVNTYPETDELAALVAKLEHGEEVVIERDGQPVARLVPVAPQRLRTRHRRLGAMKGTFTVHDSFDDPLPDDLLDAFEGPLESDHE